MLERTVVDGRLQQDSHISYDALGWMYQLPIAAFEYGNGQLVSTNTRSLAAISEAGLLPTNITLIKPTNKLLFRLQQPSLLLDSPLPGPRAPVTPSQRDLTILRVIEVPN